jgi:hypothetical protein
MKARILFSASPHQRRHRQKKPRLERGSFNSAAIAPDPGLRGKANHDDSPSVRGDSLKAPGPFSGAIEKTLRSGQWHTFRQLPPAQQDTGS